VASGRGHDAAVPIRQRDAVLWAGRLAPDEVVTVPDNAHVHLYVARGTAGLEGAGALAEGDAARLTRAGAPRLTAGDGGAEVLVWETA
jgi:redox-sensitive bicupin YhaK (pirin superfamily)